MTSRLFLSVTSLHDVAFILSSHNPSSCRHVYSWQSGFFMTSRIFFFNRRPSPRGHACSRQSQALIMTSRLFLPICDHSSVLRNDIFTMRSHMLQPITGLHYVIDSWGDQSQDSFRVLLLAILGHHIDVTPFFFSQSQPGAMTLCPNYQF